MSAVADFADFFHPRLYFQAIPIFLFYGFILKNSVVVAKFGRPYVIIYCDAFQEIFLEEVIFLQKFFYIGNVFV